MVKREGITSWFGGYVEGGYVGGGGEGGTLVGGLLDVEYVEGVRWGEGVRWRGEGGGVKWGGLGGGGSFAEKKNVESGTSTREDRSKTAQKPLKSCLKNRSKITARNERFLSGF